MRELSGEKAASNTPTQTRVFPTQTQVRSSSHVGPSVRRTPREMCWWSLQEAPNSLYRGASVVRLGVVKMDQVLSSLRTCPIHASIITPRHPEVAPQFILTLPSNACEGKLRRASGYGCGALRWRVLHLPSSSVSAKRRKRSLNTSPKGATSRE